jgi:serine/threonine protein kinase
VLVGAAGLSVVKLSDVGLSRTLASSDYYRKTSNNPVPVKWMAPESILERLYTSASDVWSFGILCWEVFSLGEPLYPRKAATEILMALKNGYRLPKPTLCRQDLFDGCCCFLNSRMSRYNVILRCWSEAPSERPTFVRMLFMLNDMNDAGTRI